MQEKKRTAVFTTHQAWMIGNHSGEGSGSGLVARVGKKKKKTTVFTKHMRGRVWYL